MRMSGAAIVARSESVLGRIGSDPQPLTGATSPCSNLTFGREKKQIVVTGFECGKYKLALAAINKINSKRII